MNVLALDLGTRTGWALAAPRESGVQVFDVKRGESPGMRYLRFNRWLDEIGGATRITPIKLIVYEQTHQRGGAATEVAAGFATRVQEFCANEDIEHAAVHSATLKKFATGRGNAKKHHMLEAAVKHKWIPFSSDAMTDDEVDAICLLHYALDELLPKAAR